MKFNVLSAEIFHETNTFNCIETTQQSFFNGYYFNGSDAIKERGNANTELAGFLDVSKKYNWQLEHILSTAASPAGVVTTATLEWLCEPIISALKNHSFDGVLLALHGAMVTQCNTDGDGEILRRVRAIIGNDIPIAITLDSHANVSIQMSQLADIVVSYKTYPHIDMRNTAIQAAEILQRRLNKEINPTTIRISCPPMLEEVNGGRTDVGTMAKCIGRAIAREQLPNVFAVSINAGFASADTSETGPTVLVTCESDAINENIQFAQSLANDIWENRFDVYNDYLEVDKAAQIAATTHLGLGPLIIADYADNPGAGAYGDSTNLLRALINAKVTDACFGPMVDSETVQQLLSHDIGEVVDINLGGKMDESYGGAPLALKAELLLKSNGNYVGSGPMIGGLHRSFGPTVVIRVASIEILITTLAQQILDLEQFKTFNINPESKRVVALKSMHHFRAAFDPIASKIIVCDSGAICTPNYKRLKYRNVVRPIFPLDV